jgi:hypothetical protein
MAETGEERAGGVFAEKEASDPQADRWATPPPMRTPRHGTGAAAVGGVIGIPAGGLVNGGSRPSKRERGVHAILSARVARVSRPPACRLASFSARPAAPGGIGLRRPEPLQVWVGQFGCGVAADPP